jgi:hypothetical protein
MGVAKAGSGDQYIAVIGVPGLTFRSFRVFDTRVRPRSMNPAAPDYAN